MSEAEGWLAHIRRPNRSQSWQADVNGPLVHTMFESARLHDLESTHGTLRAVTSTEREAAKTRTDTRTDQCRFSLLTHVLLGDSQSIHTLI